MKAFAAWQRRRAADRLERQEDAHVTSLYSNSNWDDPENDREQQVTRIKDYYRTLRREVLGDPEKKEPEVPDPQRDAFLRAGRRNLAAILPPVLPGEEAIQRLP